MQQKRVLGALEKESVQSRCIVQMVCKEQGLPAEVNARSVGASREHKGTMTALLIRRSCMIHTELIRRLKMIKKVNAVARLPRQQ